jgi:hypothetical protein
MNPTNGYYSLVQYCPDPSRVEAANVGAILFCPTLPYLDVRMSHGNDRVRRFFGSEGHNWKQINSAKEGFVRRLKIEMEWMKSVEDLQRFIDLRANELRVTAPRSIKVFDPSRQLNDIFDELVGGRMIKLPSEHAEPVRRLLSQRFSRADLSPYIRQRVAVDVPVFKVKREVPYGFQNGVFNLIDTLQFEQRTEDGVRAAACEVAVEGRSIGRHPHIELGPMHLIVVGSFGSEASEHKAMVEDIFNENEVSLYTRDSIEQLAQMIRTTGKVINPHVTVGE